MEFKQGSKNFRRFYPLIVLLLFFAFIPLALSGCGGGGGSSSSGSSSTPSATTSTVSGVYSGSVPSAAIPSLSSFTFTLDATGQFSYIDNLGDTAAGKYTLANNVLTISSGYICAPTSSTSNCSNGGGTSYAIPGTFSLSTGVNVGFPSTWNITTNSSGTVTSLSSNITINGVSTPAYLSPSLGLTNTFFANGINNISGKTFSTVSSIQGATLDSATGDYELTINGSTFYLPVDNYDDMTISGTADSSYNSDGSIGFTGTTTFTVTNPATVLSFTGKLYPGSVSAGEFDMTETDPTGNSLCNQGSTMQWYGTASILTDGTNNYITYTIYPDIPPADINPTGGCGVQSNTLMLN